jgi:Uma2 family endonuclease
MTAEMSKVLQRRRFTVDEYYRMADAGILGCDEQLELIAGQIVVREPIGARHAGTVDRLTRLWTSRLGERAIVRIQSPVRFAKLRSELQPDVMLLRPRDDFYTASHPVASDVLLLIEVTDSSVRVEKRVRIPLYARAGVLETWLCDLVSQRIEVHRQPEGRRYRVVHTLSRGEPLVGLAFPEVGLLVENLLG